MKIVVMDGKGGRLGASIVENLKKNHSDFEVYAIGTNGIATASMVKAGADYGATGENPVVVNSRDADLIIGPLGIVISDSFLGEVTPKMAVAVGSSLAKKILIPINKCSHYIIGVKEMTMSELIQEVDKTVLSLMSCGK